MKTIRATIIVFLFIAVAESHAKRINRNQTIDNKLTSAQCGRCSLDSEASSDFGTLKSSTAIQGIDNRQGRCGGTELSAPVGDGVLVLVVCCLFFVIIKAISEKRKKQINDKNHLKK
ncbi:MAG: hypothetical protein FWF52_04550 [Candidatus Azobacteroides sp.]|nr:hypothetical protein [Candidatus Azobacteroides sp.]